MNKPKFFLDFDGTLVNSNKAFISAYNILYRSHPNFVPADYKKVSQYNYKCQCPLVKNPLNIFDHELFFKDLEFINHNTYEVLERIHEKYQIVICTIGTPKNLAKKALWIEENIPFVKDYVLISNNGCKMNKSIVCMSGKGNFFLDDIPSNLDSSNCERRVLFGEKFNWNNFYQGEYALTWNDVEEMML